MVAEVARRMCLLYHMSIDHEKVSLRHCLEPGDSSDPYRVCVCMSPCVCVCVCVCICECVIECVSECWLSIYVLQYSNSPAGVSRAGDNLVVIQETTTGKVP